MRTVGPRKFEHYIPKYPGVTRLCDDAIAEIRIADTSGRYGDYAEQPSRYLVRLDDETRLRRVYVKQLGNVCVWYLKTKDGNVYCDSALNAVLPHPNTL